MDANAVRETRHRLQGSEVSMFIFDWDSVLGIRLRAPHILPLSLAAFIPEKIE